MTKSIEAVVSIVKVKKLKLVNYKQIIIQTPSAVDEQKEIILLLQGSSNLLSVYEISLSSRDLQGHAWFCFTQVCVTGQGTVIIRHSDALQFFRDQCFSDHMTNQLYNVNIKTTELLKAFIQDLGDVKNPADIAHAIRT